jgi:hypothetical protein
MRLLIIGMLFGSIISAEDTINLLEFAESYNEWTQHMNHPNLDAREITEWIHTKTAWHRIERQVDEYYKKKGYQP